MALAVRFVAHGPPALEALGGSLARAKGADPLAPVTVVPPSALAGIAARRALARGSVAGRPGVAAIAWLPLVRVAELLGAPALAEAGRRPVNGPVLARVVADELRAPGRWGAVADHPATARALAGTVTDLRAAPEAARRALAEGRRSAGQLVALHDRVAARLAGWYDEHDLFEAASRAASESAARLTGPLVVWLPPAPMAPGARRLLAALATAVDVEVLLGVTGEPEADRAVVQLAADLGHAGEPPARPPGARATGVLLAADADEEVRAAVRRVAAWVAEGTPLHEIAIFHPPGSPYAAALHQHLGAAGIPVTGPDPRRLRDTLPARTLLDLLALPDGDYARDDVIALLAAAPVVRADDRPVPVTAWERLSRRAGVVRGLDQWRERLTAYADGRREARAATEATAEDRSGQLEAMAAEEAHARELVEFVAELDRRLAGGPEGRSWTALASWCRELLKRYLGGPSRRAGWPAHEQEAFEQLERILDLVAVVDEVASGPATLADLRRLLEVELDRPAGRVGRLGHGVLVAPVEAAAGVTVARSIVLGLAEGLSPRRPGDDPFLPDRVRAGVEGLPARGVPVPEQHRRVLVALAAGRDQRLVGAPTGDLRTGRAVEPSRWLLALAAELAGRDRPLTVAEVGSLAAPWLERTESFAAGLRSGAAPAGPDDLRLRALVAAVDQVGGTVADGGADPIGTVADPVIRAAVALRRARRSPGFSRYDGNVAGVFDPAHLADRLLSPTSLEQYATCPLRYFYDHVLRIRSDERPEEIDSISARDRGSLVHAVLQEFLERVLSRPDADQPGPDEPWSAEDRALLRSIAEAHFERAEAGGITGRRLLWAREQAQLLAQLDDLLDRDDQYRRTYRARPAGVELAFGMGDGQPVVEVRHGERVLRFRGQIDRVDRTDDGGVVAIDYKTARPDAYRALVSGDPVQRGTLLQLVLYGLAARQRFAAEGPVHAGYVFIRQGAPAEPIAYEVDAARLDRFESVVATLADGISRGSFPPRPGPYDHFRQAHAHCTWCDYDRCCPAARADQWAAAREAPELADYVALAEGPEWAGPGEPVPADPAAPAAAEVTP